MEGENKKSLRLTESQISSTFLILEEDWVEPADSTVPACQ
jgi:hypothetical protein